MPAIARHRTIDIQRIFAAITPTSAELPIANGR